VCSERKNICINPRPLSPLRGEYSICTRSTRRLAHQCPSFVKEPRLKNKHLARDWQTSVAQASVRDCSGRSVDTYPRPHLFNISIPPHPIIARGVLEECAGKPGLRSYMRDQPGGGSLAVVVNALYQSLQRSSL